MPFRPSRKYLCLGLESRRAYYQACEGPSVANLTHESYPRYYTFKISASPSHPGTKEIMTPLCRIALASLSFSLCSLPAMTQQPKPDSNDTPASFTAPKRDSAAPFKLASDYIRRVEMIPMR